MGMPFEPALIFVNKTLIKLDIRIKIRAICSEKIISGYSLLRAVAMEADMRNSTRGFMFSLGCIQALQCNNNTCPTGVATKDKMLMKGLVVTYKSERVFHLHKNTLHAANELLAAAGKSSIKRLMVESLCVVTNSRTYLIYIFQITWKALHSSKKILATKKEGY